MKILIAGDSIVRGTQGESFVRLLARRHPEWQLENAGVNGNPLRSIGRRVRQRLSAGAEYDVIVLEGGYNDIFLPTFARQGFWFRQALRYLLRQGHEPLEAAAFEQELYQLVADVRARTTARLVLVTMGCLGENLATGLNPQRAVYNAAIRRVAAAHGCALADVAGQFDQLLGSLPAGSGFRQSFLSVALTDKLQVMLGRADALSRQRGLQLTIDGGHLNRRGAEVFAAVLEPVLQGAGG